MGTWMATVRFPDGTERYARYSTVVGAMSSPLHARMCPRGGVLPDGSECHRATVVGDPEPSFPDRPLSAAEDLVLVAVDHDPDHDVWHALYCPNRAQVIGPFSNSHVYSLAETFDLVRDGDGMRHLCRHAGPRTECGREITGEPSGRYQDRGDPWASRPEAPPTPRFDVFAEWHAADLCRPCLLRWLAGETETGSPAPVPARPGGSRWRRVRQFLRG